MATVVEVWQTTAACPRVRPGMAGTATSKVDRSVMTAHTSPRSAILGRIPTKTPIAMAGNSAIRNTRRTRRRVVRAPSAMTPRAYRASPGYGIVDAPASPLALHLLYSNSCSRNLLHATDTDPGPPLAGHAESAAAG